MNKLNRLFVLILILLSSSISYCQTDFKWDVIIDSLDNSKDESYFKTKLFIGETWESTQNAIQSDDAESGVILVKGLSVQNLFVKTNDHQWTYAYSIKFMMKDNKCRIVIDNVHCDAANCGTYEWAHMPVSDIYPEKKGVKTTGLNEKRYMELMTMLKSDLQMLVNSYSEYVRKPLAKDPDW